ncbi:unnamed protein product [marine sediment metagenome]|uniref:Flavodoxin-like domain-containing protein n=1 Tax=marine sediment metagenome TaxID=412755 RepID=X1CT79_9ZZZZ
MNIGIIVYSQTGNTLSAAKKLEEKLSNSKRDELVPLMGCASSSVRKPE